MFSVINSENHVSANMGKQSAIPLMAVDQGIPHSLLAFPEERRALVQVSLVFRLATVDLFKGC